MTDIPQAPRPTDPRQPGTRPWVKVVLFGSLALNMLVLGAMAAVALRGVPDHPGGKGARPAPILYYMALDRDDRKSLREAQRVNRPDPMIRQTRRDAVLAALRADPFDAAAFEAALAADLATDEDRATMLRAALVQRIGAMTAPERGDYARRIEDMARHGRQRDKGRDGKNGGAD